MMRDFAEAISASYTPVLEILDNLLAAIDVTVR